MIALLAVLVKHFVRGNFSAFNLKNFRQFRHRSLCAKGRGYRIFQVNKVLLFLLLKYNERNRVVRIVGSYAMSHAKTDHNASRMKLVQDMFKELSTELPLPAKFLILVVGMVSLSTILENRVFKHMGSI